MSGYSKAAALAVFDEAVAKVIAQGEPSVAPNKICMYRGPNGLKCAAGHFIADSEYVPGMECMLIDEVCDNFHLGWSASKRRAIRAAQSAHDRASIIWELGDGSFKAHSIATGAVFLERFKEYASNMRKDIENGPE